MSDKSQLLQELEALILRYHDAPEEELSPSKASEPEAARGLVPDYAQLAEATYDARRVRDEVFGRPDIFGEPAWDILLDLLAAAGKNKELSVNAVCVGSRAAPTTALRYIEVLCSAGWVEKRSDPLDKRRQYVSLTSEGLRLMRRFFQTAELRDSPSVMQRQANREKRRNDGHVPPLQDGASNIRESTEEEPENGGR